MIFKCGRFSSKKLKIRDRIDGKQTGVLRKDTYIRGKRHVDWIKHAEGWSMLGTNKNTPLLELHTLVAINFHGLPKTHAKFSLMGRYKMQDKTANGQCVFKIMDSKVDSCIWWHPDGQWLIGLNANIGTGKCKMYTNTKSMKAGSLPYEYTGKWKVLLKDGWKTSSDIICEAEISRSRDGTEHESSKSQEKDWRVPFSLTLSKQHFPVPKKNMPAIIRDFLEVESSDSEINFSSDWEEDDDSDSATKKSKKSKKRKLEKTKKMEKKKKLKQKKQVKQVDQKEEIKPPSYLYAWGDTFPFERNIFVLSYQYNFARRLYCSRDAIVYQAIAKNTGKPVAIKIILSNERTILNCQKGGRPKLINVVSAIQGHPNLPTLVGWHLLAETRCYAVTYELVPEYHVKLYVFGYPERIKKYMWDLLNAIYCCHNQGVMNRDIKITNVLWNQKNRQATLIDFDISTFYRSEEKHKAAVGSIGFMAPEVVHIKMIKKQIRKLKIDILYEKHNPVFVKKIKSKMKVLRKQLKKACYGYEIDIYSAGIVLGVLLFEKDEQYVLSYSDKHSEQFGDSLRRELKIIQTKKPKKWTKAHALLVKMIENDVQKRITLEAAMFDLYFAPLNTDFREKYQHNYKTNGIQKE